MDPNWLAEPEEENYPDGYEYLGLVVDETVAKKTITALKRSRTVMKKARDILRASGYSALSYEDAQVRSHVQKIRDGEDLSPVLLVRPSSADGRLIIADGYHRVCAAHIFDESAEVACRIVSLPSDRRVR